MIIILLIAIVACSKYKRVVDDVGGNGTLYGRLFLVDTVLGQGIPTPFGKQVVYLFYSADSLPYGNFLITAQTDSLGYFNFTSLRTDSYYRVEVNDTINGLVYEADTVMKAGNDSLALTVTPALYASIGFRYSFSDSHNGGAIPGVQVCVLTSQILAYAAGGDTCAGSNYQLKSDSFGRAYLFDIPPGMYYTQIRTNYTALPINFLDSVVVVTDSPTLRYYKLPQ
jgi:hypothetical protein